MDEFDDASMKIALFTLGFLLAGCATLPPYATDDSMADRTRCLRAGGMWVETQQQYGCRAPAERERTWMSWWWSAPDPVTFRYPHAIVNGNVTDEALSLMPPTSDQVLARSFVLRDGPAPMAVFHFSAGLGLSERQLRVIAHEASHVMAQTLGLLDRTHDVDGGVIR